MANNRGNCLIRHTSGKIGNIVLTSNGYVRSQPEVGNRVWSPLQKEHLNRFELAKEYARMAISDPVKNEFYARKALRKPGLGAWHLAIRDFCHPSEIDQVNFSGWKGRCGDEVYVAAYDIFEVQEVILEFNSPDGLLLEKGSCKEMISCWPWKYVMRSDMELVPGLNVTIQSIDIPGNITSKSLTWPFDCQHIIRFKHSVPPGVAKRLKSQLRPGKDLL